jgi:uncharacterized surface protein with fasciclin (FAS1) repeats
MHLELLSLAAATSLAAAQSMNLSAALGSNPNLSNLTQYLGLYPNIIQQLSNATNVTLLAPNNDAFTKALSGPVNVSDTSLINAVFSYHVLDGLYPASAITSKAAFIPTALVDSTYTNLTSGQRVEAIKAGKEVVFYSGLLQNSTVTQADTNFTGGVIHVVDNFLTIPQNISTTLVVLNETSALGALEMAGIASGPLPANLTAFIPNNAAFQNIGSVLANLTMQDLGGILGYHIVPDVVGYSTALTNGTKLTSLTNGTLTITIDGKNVFVNSAKVVVPNVLVKEGVVHVIDNVLNPQDSTAKPNVTASTQTPAFSGASKASEVPFTSNVPTPSSAIATPSAGATGAAGSSSSGAATSSSTSGIAMPMKTGAVGVAALFGGAAVMMNM